MYLNVRTSTPHSNKNFSPIKHEGIGMKVNGAKGKLVIIGGGIIELNAAPGLRMHLYPSEGKPRDVGRAIIEMIYPAGNDGRIPIISVTGTNGKTTVTRMI